MRVAALVLAAGRGERLRRSLPPSCEVEPKAFVALGGRSLLAHALSALAGAAEIEWIQPVLPHEELERGGWEQRAGVEERVLSRLLPAVAGGAERQDSVAAGLAVLPREATHVAVHDAARPLVRSQDVRRVVAAALRWDAALLATPVADTVHRGREGRVRETPVREELWAAQTPQVFRVEILREALEKARAAGIRGTDEAGLVARLGVAVHIVPGDPTNRKITTGVDLAWAEALLSGLRP